MILPFKIDLSNKVAVVTGGNGILGSLWCKALAQCGAKVAILGTNIEKSKKLALEIKKDGGEAIAVIANVVDKESLMSAHHEIIEKIGTCDILINGAGGNHKQATTTKEYLELNDIDNKELITFFDLDQEGINHVFDLNFLGTLYPSQVFAKDMIGKKGATIINISSMNAFTPLTKIPAYSSAKAAVSNFTQWLAVHFSKVGIRVNAMAPGFFLTSQNEKLLKESNGNYTDRALKIIKQTPMQRFGDAKELIGTLLYLIDENSSGFMTGVVIPIDGGFSSYAGV